MSLLLLFDNTSELSLIVSDDNSANWFEAISGDFFGDINWLDDIAEGIGINLSDDLNNWLDDVAEGIGIALFDDLNNWLDEVLTLGPSSLDLSDDLNNWLDNIALLLGYELSISDDNSGNWLDAIILNFSYLENLSDDLNNWLDLVDVLLSYLLPNEDDLNNWLDDLLLGIGEALNDDLNSWDDLIEISFIEISLGLTDDLNNWLEDGVVVLSSVTPKLVDVEDDIGGNYNDSVDNSDSFEYDFSDDDLNEFNDELDLFRDVTQIEFLFDDDLNNFDDDSHVVNFVGSGFAGTMVAQTVVVLQNMTFETLET